MTKSALQIARAAYQPKLPKALASGAVKVVAGAATQSVADQEAIKALFPNTYGMPLITFEAGEAVAQKSPSAHLFDYFRADYRLPAFRVSRDHVGYSRHYVHCRVLYRRGHGLSFR